MSAEAEADPSPDESPVKVIDALLPEYAGPHQIKAHLDQFVVGQEAAKTELSTLLSMHLLLSREPGHKLQTPNALLVGPTGVGKTYSVRTAAGFLRLPVVVADATKLLPSGASAETGEHIDYLLAELLDAAQEIVNKIDRDARREIAKVLRREYGYRGRSGLDSVDDLLAFALAERGIVFLDEFDKLSFAGAAPNVAGWNRSIQGRLLKLVEGSEDPPMRVRGIPPIDTSGMLFIAAGAFARIDSKKDYASVLPTKPYSLHGSARSNLAADVVTYGFIPELIARFPILVRYSALAKDDLRRMLSNTATDPLQVFSFYFEKNGKRLVVTDEALEAIASHAQVLEMGARGIHQVIFPQIAKVAYAFFQQSDEAVYELTRDAVDQFVRGSGAA